LGKTLVHELFDDTSPIGKEVRVNDVPLRVVGVLAAKGTNIIGIDQDDILLAPWSTIKYRVSGSSLASVNHASSGSSAGSGSNDLMSQLDLLSRKFPRSLTGLYPSQSDTQLVNTP